MQPFVPYLIVLVSALLVQGCAPLVVGGAATGVAVVHDRRTPGSVVEDQGIELTIFDYKHKHPEVTQRSTISSTSYNRQVLLTGTSESRAVADQLVNYVRGLSNVRGVIDEIEVMPPDRGIRDTMNDSYLTSQAKVALFRINKIKDFDPSRVKVTTYNGSIYLMGMVTPEEGNAAAEEIRYVNGVKRVVKHFEYVDAVTAGAPAPATATSRGNVTTTPLREAPRDQVAAARNTGPTVYGGSGGNDGFPTANTGWQ